jgi:hypothetical protein
MQLPFVAARRTWLAGIFAVLATVLATSAAMAQAPAKAVFGVRVIEAGKAPAGKIDPRLSDLESKLKAFPFNQFTLVREQALDLQPGGRGSVRLPDGEFATTLLGFEAGRARTKVEFPRSVQTRVMAIGAKTLDIVTGGERATIIATSYDR